MGPTSSASPRYHPSSPTGGAGPSARTASPEPGRTNSTDKSDQPKSCFNISFSPSRLASKFSGLFGGKQDEAKEHLKQIAQEILDQVSKNIGGMNLDEKTKKKLNSSLRKTMTAEEMRILADTLNAAESLGKNKEVKNMMPGFSSMMTNFASGKMDKAQFMADMKNISTKLDDLKKEGIANSAAHSQLRSLFVLDQEIYESAHRKYKEIKNLESPADKKAKFEEFAARLELVNARLEKGVPFKKCLADVALFNPVGRQPERVANRAAINQLRSLRELDPEIFESARLKYEAIKNLESPADKKAKFEEFAARLELVNARLEQGVSFEKCLADVALFNPDGRQPERVAKSAAYIQLRSLRELDQKIYESARRKYEAIKILESPADKKAKFEEFAARLELVNARLKNRESRAECHEDVNLFNTSPSSEVAYTGPKLSIAGAVRPAEASKHAAILKQHFNAASLQELHSDLLALAINATEDTMSAFNKKYKKVFVEEYTSNNYRAFSVLGKQGLKGCEGNAQNSKFWSLPSTHV